MGQLHPMVTRKKQQRITGGRSRRTSRPVRSRGRDAAKPPLVRWPKRGGVEGWMRSKHRKRWKPPKSPLIRILKDDPLTVQNCSLQPLRLRLRERNRGNKGGSEPKSYLMGPPGFPGSSSGPSTCWGVLAPPQALPRI